MQNYQELLDIVDDHDNIIGQDTRENVHKKGLAHREISVWLFNNKGEFLFEKRDKTKETFPGLLNVPVGGHVDQGEDYLTTALKELKEEAGISAALEELVFLNKMHKISPDSTTHKINNAFRVSYGYRFNGTKESLHMEAGPNVELQWWSYEKLLKLSPGQKKDFAETMFDPEFMKVFEKISKLTQ